MSQSEAVADTQDRRRRGRRGGFLVPVFLLLIVSLGAIAGLGLIGAYSLNREHRTITTELAAALLDLRRATVTRLVEENGTAEPTLAALIEGLEREWTGPTDLAESFGVTWIAVVTAAGTPVIAIRDGQRNDQGTVQSLPADLVSFAASAREGQTGEAGPVFGYGLLDGEVQAIAARPTPPELSEADEPVEGPPPMLLIAAALDRGVLADARATKLLPELGVISGAPAEDQISLPLAAPDGRPIGRLAWQDTRPGTELLWRLAPAVIGIMLAMLYLLSMCLRGARRLTQSQKSLGSALQDEHHLYDWQGRMFAGAAHEMRTPLATIRTSNELLERHGRRMSEQERDDEFAAISGAINRINGLVDQILLLGKYGEGPQDEELEQIDLNRFVQEVWDEAVHALEAPHQLVLRAISPNTTLVGDPDSLRGVLSNLFQNAIKFEPVHCTVVVELGGDAKTCVITVEDTGDGIPPGERDEVFEPFRRGSNAEDVPGSGLGLAIARTCANRMGGTLTLDPSYDAGARFQLSLPRGR